MELTGSTSYTASKDIFRPGGTYYLVLDTSVIYWTKPMDLWIGLKYGDLSTDHVTLPAVHYEPGGFPAPPFGPRGVLTIPADASNQLKWEINCNNCKLEHFSLKLLPSYYRVTQKKLYDGINSAPYTFSYRYDEPATNDSLHSYAVQQNPTPYVKPYTEYRGHAMVQEIGPDGKVTTTTFRQGDALFGHSQTTIVSKEKLNDQFNSLDTSKWIFSHANTYQTIERITGDNALKTTNPNNDYNVQVYRPANTLNDKDAVLLQFRITSLSGALNLYTDTGTWGTSSYRRWGIGIPADRSMTVSYHNGTSWITVNSVSASSIKLDNWYCLLLILDNHHLFARVWERDNAEIVVVSSDYNPGSSLGGSEKWRFAEQINLGTAWLDFYNEGRSTRFPIPVS